MQERKKKSNSGKSNVEEPDLKNQRHAVQKKTKGKEDLSTLSEGEGEENHVSRFEEKHGSEKKNRTITTKIGGNFGNAPKKHQGNWGRIDEDRQYMGIVRKGKRVGEGD